ncbi:MAG: hypothetical protein ACJ73E_12155 [Mycobacteriales bacterium]
MPTSVDGDMQRPGWDPADPPSPPSPPPLTAPTGDAGRTRVAAGPGAVTPGEPAPHPAGRPAPGPPAPGPEDAPPGPQGGAQPVAYRYATGPYGAGVPGAPWPPQRPSWPPSRRELSTAVAALVGLAALGAALAVLWVRLAPRLEFRVVEPGRAMPVVPEAEEYVAADGRFVLLTLAAGVVAGLAFWLLRGSRGPVVLAAVAFGGLLGAVVTWRLGVWLEPGYHPEDLQVVGRTVTQPLELRARAGLVVEPIAAVLVYLLGAGFTVHNDLGVDPPVS